VFKLAVITDEISQDLAHSLAVAREMNLDGVELRSSWGKNIVDFSDSEVDKTLNLLQRFELTAVAISSPLFKVHRPGAGGIVTGDTFMAEGKSPEDHLDMIPRLIELAGKFSAPVVRCFSFWREATVGQETLRDISRYLSRALEIFKGSGVTVALENEHETNLGTAASCRPVLERLGPEGLGFVWDPGNALVAGENPYPDGYELVKEFIVHVHLKDLRLDPSGKPVWLPIGEGAIDYAGQLKALLDDGYTGYLSLETHYVPENGDKELGTRRSLEGLRRLIEEVTTLR